MTKRRPAAQWLTIAEAAARLRVSTKTIRRYIDAGRLEVSRVGPKMIRIDVADLDALIVPIPAAPRPGRRAPREPQNADGG